ncbi:hypothetical protein NQ317_005407 [Molorchus minor]|uniref:Carboxylic ester hydrolase n=1 Tax=Molorchus minor TaxID=1323400 RepID=A0ABQ9IY76_9CUCU|nr:hypothetical protein NQ317_005407 [Molorchus minor]
MLQLPLLLFIVGVQSLPLADEITVTIPNGQILGRERVSRENSVYYAFQEIPYASPPVGGLRFQDPVPAPSWSGVLDARVNTKKCYQQGDVASNNINISQTEDCLYLNVYTPLKPATNYTELLPVLFWIHGGGFIIGDGFLTTEDDVIPSNLGLKDQNLALIWASKNIIFFGGDPQKITIAGGSAGAASVGHLLISKKSSGAILESGTGITFWAHQSFAKYCAYQLGSAINANFTSDNTSEELLQLLLEASPADIINTTIEITPEMDNQLGTGLNIIWAPVIDKEDVTNVDNVTGHLLTLGAYLDADLSRVINNKFNMTSQDKIKAGEALKNIYTKGNFQDDLSALIMVSDQAFTTPAIRHAAVQSLFTDVYLYQFSYRGKLSEVIVRNFEGTDKVGHGEEILYMWDYGNDLSQYPPSDTLTHKRLLLLWSNFIKFLNPTPGEDDLLDNVLWTKTSADNLSYLNINNTLEVKNDPKHYKDWKPIIDAYAIPPLTNY